MQSDVLQCISSALAFGYKGLGRIRLCSSKLKNTETGWKASIWNIILFCCMRTALQKVRTGCIFCISIYRPKMYNIPRFYNNNGNKTSLQILGGVYMNIMRKLNIELINLRTLCPADNLKLEQVLEKQPTECCSTVSVSSLQIWRSRHSCTGLEVGWGTWLETLDGTWLKSGNKQNRSNRVWFLFHI